MHKDPSSKNVSTGEYSVSDLIKSLPEFEKKGITEVILHGESLSRDKRQISELVDSVLENYPELFISIPLDVNILDQSLADKLYSLNVSIEIPLKGIVKNGNLLFDKKLYSGRAKLLNERGMVFGFSLSFASQDGDSFKAFRDRLSFAISLYPNHIDFPQFEENPFPKSTGFFSSKDIEFAREMAFACRTFYTCGRAVPWFLSALKALKMDATSFFADFSEWQQCSSCSFDSLFLPEDSSHAEIEKMQLTFLKEKFEEKHKEDLFPVMNDIVRLNGAFSRLAGEGEVSVIKTSYNPDDILSPLSLDIARFADEVTLEESSVKIFENEGQVDYKILS